MKWDKMNWDEMKKDEMGKDELGTARFVWDDPGEPRKRAREERKEWLGL
jgi:hypothetical protein